jgi:hypothetical protein
MGAVPEPLPPSLLDSCAAAPAAAAPAAASAAPAAASPAAAQAARAPAPAPAPGSEERPKFGGSSSFPTQDTRRKARNSAEPMVPEFAATGADATVGQLRRMQELIRLHLQRSKLEVIVVVEAIDPHSSNTFQARHSYTAEDIEFDKSFQACMQLDPSDGMARLDWNSFHEVYKVPFNAAQIIGGSHS